MKDMTNELDTAIGDAILHILDSEKSLGMADIMDRVRRQHATSSARSIDILTTMNRLRMENRVGVSRNGLDRSRFYLIANKTTR